MITTPASTAIRLPHRPRVALYRRVIVRHLAVFGLFLLLATIWLRPLPWQMTDHVTGPGDPLTTAWRLAWPAQWLTDQPAPFWETNVLYPASNVFARDELTLGESSIAGPIYVLTHNALFAYNLTLLMTLALSGFTMYCLVWHFLRHRTAAVIGGIIFALAPYHLAQLDHAGLLAVQWLPLIILFLDRALHTRRWRDAGLLGGLIAMQAISAGYYAYWSAIIVVLFLGYVILSRRWLLSWCVLGRIGAALVVAFVALLPIIVPFKTLATTETFARSMHEVEYWSARPQTWLAATPNSLAYGGLVRAHAWTWSTEMYLLPGAIALTLGALALIGGKRGRVRWFALALTCVGFVLSLGPYLHLARRDAGRFPLPYLLVHRLIPGGDALRAPVRAAPIAMLGVAILAAIGWQRLAGQMRKSGVRREVRWAAATVLCLALCGEYAVAPLHTVRVPQLRDDRSSLVHWLREQPPSVVAVLPDLRAPVTMALATTTHHRFINGDAEIMPPATRALFDHLRTFPSPETIRTLEALGVDLLVLDRSLVGGADWEGMVARIGGFPADLVPAASLNDAMVYRVAPVHLRYGTLLDAIPAAASVCIGSVQQADPTYLDRAVVTHLLHDRQVRGNLTTGWTSQPVPLKTGEQCDYGFFGLAERIPPEYDSATAIWSDGMLTLYRAQEG